MMQLGNLTLNKKNIILTVIIAILVIGNVVLAAAYFSQVQEIQTLQKELTIQKTNAKVADFLKLFVVKVLKSDKEISFEDRLQLENAIRNINDPDILSKWEQFTAGTNEAQIQDGVKALLETLADKISY